MPSNSFILNLVMQKERINSMEPFIKNAQYNYIQKQISWVKDSLKQHLPPGVLASVFDITNEKIANCIPHLSDEQHSLVDFSSCKSAEAYEQKFAGLENYIQPFPTVTEQQLKKIFPKSKKLKLPNMSTEQLSYYSWIDSRSNKKYILYMLDNQLVGIECTFSPSTRKNICSICSCHAEVTQFSTITKAKKVNNPDYYKAIGNYICMDSVKCNKNITDTTYLEEFLRESLKTK